MNARCIDGYAAADVVVTANRDIDHAYVAARLAGPQSGDEWSRAEGLEGLLAGQSRYYLFPLPSPAAAAAFTVVIITPDPLVRDIELPPVNVAAQSCAGSPTAPLVTAEVAECADADGGSIAVTMTDPPGGPEYHTTFRVEWLDAPPDSDRFFVSYMTGAESPDDGEQVTEVVEDFGYTECCGYEPPGGAPEDVPDRLGAGDYRITYYWLVTMHGTSPSGLVDGVVEEIEGGTIELTLPACATTFRVASFDASLSRPTEGELATDLSTPDDPQASTVAEVLQHTRPDVVLLGGFDIDDEAVEMFRNNYIAASQGDADPIEYPYSLTAPVNAGLPSEFDLDNDGTVGGPGDVVAPGEFAGQAGMTLLSRYPIATEDVRTFQLLPWAAMPGARLPDDPATAEPQDWFSADELAVLPLASASMWDVPIDVDGNVVHLLASSPAAASGATGDPDGWRNADEIRFWAEYVAGDDPSWIVDDAGTAGGLADGAPFIIAGNLGRDPVDSEPAVMAQLLGLDAVQDPEPASDGGTEAAAEQGGANATQQGDPATDTADLTDDPEPGNLRTDYVLPSVGLEVIDSGVFWPGADDPLATLVSDPTTSSNHRLVWVDVRCARVQAS